MIFANARELSQILYEADPMGTCCAGNSGMENEYDQIAATILECAEDMSDLAAVEKSDCVLVR